MTTTDGVVKAIDEWIVEVMCGFHFLAPSLIRRGGSRAENGRSNDYAACCFAAKSGRGRRVMHNYVSRVYEVGQSLHLRSRCWERRRPRLRDPYLVNGRQARTPALPARRSMV